MKNSLIVILICIPFFLKAQEHTNAAQLYNYAVKLQNDGKLDDAMTVFKNLLKNDSSNLNYLQHTSYLYSKLGYLQPSENLKMQWFHTAEYLAGKAISKNSNSADAHYVYALALGRINEHAGNREKIANAKIIKSEAEAAIRLNPLLGGPYHILGKWHQVVAGFNAIERAMINTLFGGMPGGSYDDAIKNFQKAIELEPTTVTIYELAVSYHERNHVGDREAAVRTLEKAISLPVRNEDEQFVNNECRLLLNKLVGK